MPRTPKNNPDDFVVSAYQNPYSGKLFAMEQKDEFLKELRDTQRRLKEERQRAKLLQERKDLWTRIRTEVSSVNDIEMFCRAQCSQEMENLYLRAQHRERLSSSDFWSLPVLKTQIEHFSISHDAPLGTPSNWCLRDETRVGHKIALRIESSRNLNSTMYEYSKSESGFRVLNKEMYLFADDWPFVQRMALGEFLEGNLKSTMSRHPINEFVADLERYSVLQTGMPLSQLKDLHAMGVNVDADSSIRAAGAWASRLHRFFFGVENGMTIHDDWNTQCTHDDRNLLEDILGSKDLAAYERFVFDPLRGPKTWRILRHEQSEFGE